jgi:O-antigen/teichoic acid export membrane protein
VAPPLETTTIAERDLSADEIRQRAIHGVALIGLRGMAIRLLGFAGNIVLARLLVPEDFGILAFGQSFVVLAGFVMDAGVGAALLRRAEPPDEHDLGAVLGLQLTLTIALAAAAAATSPADLTAQITAVMISALPLGVLRTPTAIVYERGLRYAPMAFAEVAEVLVYLVWSVTAVALGAGVWGVATAVVVRSAVGSGVLLARSPVRQVRPVWDWPRLRRLWAFGAQFQAVQFVHVARSQGLNLATAAIAGLPVLGLWSLAERLMLVPFLLFEGLLRVSFPALARLAGTGTHLAKDLDRSLSVGTIASGILLVGLGASAPASIPVVFGTDWTGASDAVGPACLGLLIGGPIAAAGMGYLYAVGNARRVLVCVIVDSLVWAVVALPLLPAIGAGAIGWGWLAHAVVDVVILGGALRGAGVRVLRSIAVPVLAGSVAGIAGFVFARSEPATPVTALAAAAGSLAAYLAVLFACHRVELRQAMRTATRAGRAVMARG